MKFDTLTIDKQWRGEPQRIVKYERSDLDRVAGDNGPQYGFYHFPRKKGVKKAFQELKEKMIEDQEKIIKNALKIIDELKAVDLPAWIIENEIKNRKK